MTSIHMNKKLGIALAAIIMLAVGLAAVASIAAPALADRASGLSRAELSANAKAGCGLLRASQTGACER
jgi:ABC-type enterobactin transport system permease subunit